MHRELLCEKQEMTGMGYHCASVTFESGPICQAWGGWEDMSPRSFPSHCNGRLTSPAGVAFSRLAIPGGTSCCHKTFRPRTSSASTNSPSANHPPCPPGHPLPGTPAGSQVLETTPPIASVRVLRHEATASVLRAWIEESEPGRDISTTILDG